MTDARLRWAIGLMSGTALDGIDAALIKSDGRARVAFGPTSTTPYDAALAERLGAPVEPVGWDGDALEAQAFAYLTLRSLDGLPLSLPGTTGVPRPVTGGTLHKAA